MYSLIIDQVLTYMPSRTKTYKNPNKADVKTIELMQEKINTVIRVRYGAIIHSGNPNKEAIEAIVIMVAYEVLVTRKTLPPAHPLRAPKFSR